MTTPSLSLPIPPLANNPLAAALAPTPGHLGDSIVQGLVGRLTDYRQRWQAEQDRQRVERAVRRGSAVVLGSTTQTYRAVDDRSPLRILADAVTDGLEVQLTVRPGDIEAEIPLLETLDHRHVVRVDVVAEPATLRGALATVRAVAQRGLAARLLVQRTDAPVYDLDALHASARDAGALDVIWGGNSRGAAASRDSAASRDPNVAREITVQRLRHGFPHCRPGRG